MNPNYPLQIVEIKNLRLDEIVSLVSTVHVEKREAAY